ncbi:hypothetical protein [Streptococcus pluranimalium]|uniref:hypothetical protein n=1 Tax=Streptococcus pluranimalium TaxID=82348 RepID=UPI0039FBE4AD
MDFQNITTIVTGFITYGIPILSLLWQIRSDLSDKKQIENIISNYNYQNNSNFDFRDISIQNGYIQINNPQSINIDLKDELDKFENERFEDRKFLSSNLLNISFGIILILFILNLINNFLSHGIEINIDVIINNLVISFDKTLNQLLLMLSIYVLSIVVKYGLGKQRITKTIGFAIATILYLWSYFATKQGFIQAFKYPANLSELSPLISVIVAVVILLLLFFSLNVLVKRLFDLILVYESKLKTSLINNFNSISIVIAPILILVVRNFLR